MDPILILLGVLVVACTALQGVGVFTQAWITNGEGRAMGIVPYYVNDPTWLIASSIMMWASFFTFVLVLTYYIILMIKISKFGYLSIYRRFLYQMVLEVILVIGLTVVSLILVGTNINKFGLYLGYSAWICVGSISLSLGIIGICMHSLKKFNETQAFVPGQ